MNTSNRNLWFRELLKQYPRIAIAGGPKSAKTTLSRLATRRKVFHSDHFKVYKNGYAAPTVEDDRFDSEHLDRSPEAWSQASKAMCDAVNAHQGACVVEGVRVPHALRKGMRVDAVVWLDGALVELRPGQKSMAKAGKTILDEWAKAHPETPVLVAPPPPKFSEQEPDDFDVDAST